MHDSALESITSRIFRAGRRTGGAEKSGTAIDHSFAGCSLIIRPSNLQLHSSLEVQHPKRTTRISIFSSTGETAVQTCVMFNVSTRQLPRSAMSTGSRQAGEKLSRCRLTRVMRDVPGGASLSFRPTGDGHTWSS
ncbi:hypothetical protein RRG08_065309 [Elysia crispata]|uniref:Uncharacterized protein n=1 Tax=Elysia crispata TaxID=231223 RepID=A0AAE1DM18_9GAST|nr:hypothetical protein RRG08_065309 [Elysia crispata]